MTEIKPYPLAWPSDWPRTSVKDQRPNQQWKKSLDYYRQSVLGELAAMKVTRFILSTNVPVTNSRGELAESAARTINDVGVAVYFERPLVEDFKWMTTLMLTGVPTENDIDVSFKRLAMPHHPDRGGDAKLFVVYSEARELGRKWARRTQSPPSLVLPCDTFKDVRLNLAGAALSLKCIRQLERCGTSQLLERTFQSMTVGLPATAGADGRG